jgi:hypothetical protein
MEGMDTSLVTPETGSEVAESESQEQEGTESEGQKVTPKQGGRDQKATPKAADSDEEEVKIGSVSAKLPKSVAKVVKDLERGFHLKAQEAAKAKRELDELSKADLKELAKRRGLDPYEFAEATLAEKLEQLAMSPEERELRELRAERQAREEEAKRQKQEAEAQERTAREQKEYQAAVEKYDRELAEGFKEADLPKSPVYIAQVAFHLVSAKKQGVDLSVKEAIDKVRESFEPSLESHVRSLSVDRIQKLLGADLLKALREAEVKRVTGNTAPTPNSIARPGGSPVTSQSKRPKVMSEKEWKAWHDSLKG